MFGLFGKKPSTAMDGLIRAVYGQNPPAKTADLKRAITIAHEDLLQEQIVISEVQQHATALFNGPMPYSTHDLAVSTALAFFKRPESLDALQECQLSARMRVLDWAKAGKVVHPLARSFEEVLYRIYKDSAIRPRHTPLRASPRALDAFRAIWIGIAPGSPIEEYFNQHVQVWEQQYQSTLAICKSGDLETAINNVIAGIMQRVVNGSDKAVSISKRMKADANDLGGAFIIIGLLSHIVFGHVPAVAESGDLDPDKLCYDVVMCIQESVNNRRSEMNSDYANGVNEMLDAFNAALFPDKWASRQM